MFSGSLGWAVALLALGADLPELPPPGQAANRPVILHRGVRDYVIEPPDVLRIVPSSDVDRSKVTVGGIYRVEWDGTIDLGKYGRLFVAGLTAELAQLKVAHVVTKEAFEEKDYYDKFRQVVRALKVEVVARDSQFIDVIWGEPQPE
jgi:hypothetical protein